MGVFAKGIGSVVSQSGGTLNYRTHLDIKPGNRFEMSGGTLNGSLSIDGDFNQRAEGMLRIEIGGTTAGESFDLLTIVGDTTLSGSLEIALLDGFVPSANHQFKILDADALSGTFANALGVVHFAGGRFDVVYSSTGVTLTNFSSVPKPAGASILAVAAATIATARPRRRA